MRSDPMLVRFYHPDMGPRFGIRTGEHVAVLNVSLAEWLQDSAGQADEAISGLLAAAETADVHFSTDVFANAPAENMPHWLAPIDEQEVWAAGVTYERSRAARQEESVDGGDIYARVYNALRPEIFFKAPGWRVVGPGEAIGVRNDATWSVPEPELGLVLNPALEMVGLTIGNDVSSRDIEGTNPLYLPQAKIYNRSCALGPGILLGRIEEWPVLTIRIRIERDGVTVFGDSISTKSIHRALPDLVEHLGRALHFPNGVVLLTGTGVVPPDDFTLDEGDIVTINIEDIGTLTNPVQRV